MVTHEHTICRVRVAGMQCCHGCVRPSQVGLSSDSPAARLRAAGRNTKLSIVQRLEIGSHVDAFLTANPGLKDHRWHRVAHECFGLRYSPAVAARLRRCWAEWTVHSNSGAYTQAASGGMLPNGRRRCRRAYATPRPKKMECLWFELLQWFVDEVEELRSRADSTLLLNQARVIRDRLIEQGHPPAACPKIDKHFLFNWRAEYGLCMRATTVRFKVSLVAAIARVRTMLLNIFRLRHLWALCFGGHVPMRWISFDQKPSWFNNAGLRPQLGRKGARKVGAREDHHGTRQRYTVMTTVQSWPRAIDASTGGVTPPKMAVLFKADNGARDLAILCFVRLSVVTYIVCGMHICVLLCTCIHMCVVTSCSLIYACDMPCAYVPLPMKHALSCDRRTHYSHDYALFACGGGIRARLAAPPWLLIQFQERGSYREEDVLAFLDWALEPAACPTDSTVVMLDWYSAHTQPEVAALIARKGHVLLLHGGGVIGIEQVNDTWLL